MFSKKITFSKARMISFDFMGEKELRISVETNCNVVHLPANVFQRYAVIELQ